MTRAVSIMSPPQIAWEMCSVPLPTWGYPVRTKKNRLPSTPPTAQARKISRCRDNSVLLIANVRIRRRSFTTSASSSCRVFS